MRLDELKDKAATAYRSLRVAYTDAFTFWENGTTPIVATWQYAGADDAKASAKGTAFHREMVKALEHAQEARRCAARATAMLKEAEDAAAEYDKQRAQELRKIVG